MWDLGRKVLYGRAVQNLIEKDCRGTRNQTGADLVVGLAACRAAAAVTNYAD